LQRLRLRSQITPHEAMGRPVINEVACQRLAAAIIKRAVLDATHNTTGYGFDARNWLLFDPLAACLYETLGLSRRNVWKWVLALDPLPQEALPSAEDEQAEVEPPPDVWTFEQLAERVEVDIECIVEMVRRQELETIEHGGQVYVAQTSGAWRFLYQRWRISVGLDDATE
jgi:hypothetical protein